MEAEDEVGVGMGMDKGEKKKEESCTFQRTPTLHLESKRGGRGGR